MPDSFFIYIVVCLRGLFFSLLCCVPLRERQNLFILSPVDGHLVCFQFFAIVRELVRTFLHMSLVGMHLFLVCVCVCVFVYGYMCI